MYRPLWAQLTVVQTGIPKGEKQVRYVVYSSKLRTRLAVSDEVLRKVPGVQSPQGSIGSSPVVQGVIAQQGQGMAGPGSSVIARDITIGGKVAFREGERVTVEGVAPHPQMPDHKYVVLSNALQKRFQLKAEDIRDLNIEPPEYNPLVPTVGQPVNTGHPYPGPNPDVSPVPPSGLNRTLIIIAVGLVTAIASFGITTAVIITSRNRENSVTLSPNTSESPPPDSSIEDIHRRTCQAWLRTIDGAINTYNGEYGAYPPNGDVGSILVPYPIKVTPSCPTSDETYTMVDGSPNVPPVVTCPTGEYGHTI